MINCDEWVNKLTKSCVYCMYVGPAQEVRNHGGIKTIERRQARIISENRVEQPEKYLLKKKMPFPVLIPPWPPGMIRLSNDLNSSYVRSRSGVTKLWRPIKKSAMSTGIVSPHNQTRKDATCKLQKKEMMDCFTRKYYRVWEHLVTKFQCHVDSSS